MATIADVRAELARVIAAGVDVRTSAYQRDAVTAPEVHVGRSAMDPRMVFSSTTSVYAFTATLFVRRADDEAAQRFLDEVCEVSGPRSMVAAVQDGDVWVADLVDYAQVVNVGETVIVERGGVEYLAVQFEIEVVF